MRLVVNLLIGTLAVWITGSILPGVHLEGFWDALIVAVLLGIVNVLVKPVLIVLTLPITLVSLGLFLFVINALMILLVDVLVSGFAVDNFWWALLFSLVVSIVTSFLNSLSKPTE